MNRKIGVLLSYVLMVFEVLSTLLLTPFILRTLGQSEYGVYRLAGAINAYLLLLDLGVGNAIIRYVAKYRAENNQIQGRRFLGVVTIYYLAIAVITLIVGGVLVGIFPTAFAKGLLPEEIRLGQQLLSIIMVNSAVTLGSAAYTNIIIAYEKFWISQGSSIIQIIFRIILTYVALICGMGSIGIVIVNLVTTLLCRGFFVYYTLFKIKFRPLFKGIEFSFIKEIVQYSSLILLQMIATEINSSVDQILIGSLVSTSAGILAVYSVGTQIVQYFQSFGRAFTGVIMPGIVHMVEREATPREITDEMIRIGRIIFMVLGLILGGFLVLGKEFISLWAGEENQQAYFVAATLMLAYIFIQTQAIGSQVLWAKNQHKEQAIAKMVIVLMNVVLTVFLIQIEPLYGATIGTFLSLLMGDIIVKNFIFVKKIKFDFIYYCKNLFKGIIPCLLISATSGIVANQFIADGWASLILKIMIMCIVYVVTMLLFGMNSYEKKMCFSLVKKLSKSSGGK